MQLSWTIEGEQQLSRNLLIMASKVKDWGPAFAETGTSLVETFSNEVFTTEGAVIEEHWSPLKKAYALEKAKKYEGKGILERTGAMRRSFVATPTPVSVEIKNTSEYFKYHQSNQPRTKIPRRPMMKLANAQKEMVVRIFNTYFQLITQL